MQHTFEARAVLSLEQTVAVMKGLEPLVADPVGGIVRLIFCAGTIHQWSPHLSPRQMGAMMEGLCIACGGAGIDEARRDCLIDLVGAPFSTATVRQNLMMLEHLRRALHATDGSISDANRIAVDAAIARIKSDTKGTVG
jgi:hypothetical protein